MVEKKNIIKKMRSYLAHPSQIVGWLIRKGCFNWLPDQAFLKLEHRVFLGDKLDLKNPQTFNEKLQWLKLYNKDIKYSMMVDKYLVRQYVADVIGDQYLIPLIGAYDNANQIDFSSLPNKFVLKANHGSGWNVVCLDKEKLNWGEEKAKLNRWLKSSYFKKDREYPYKNIIPKIVCEEFIKTDGDAQPNDYKIFCFDGEPKFFFIASDRGVDTKFDFFDMDWKRYPVRQFYPNSNYEFVRPQKWDEMVECAKKLSNGFPHVRVDFYVDSKNNIYFGELTFCHFGGVTKFEPEEFDDYFGGFINLPID